MKKKLISTLLVIFLTLISCNVEKIIDEGVVKIIIHPQEETKTISPEIFPNIHEYRITCTGPEIKDPVITANSTVEIILQTGYWDITIEALNINGDIVSIGSVHDIPILIGNSTDIVIDLLPTQNSTGSLSIIVDWPISFTIPSENISVEFDNTVINLTSELITLTTTSLTFSSDSISSASDHTFKLSLRPTQTEISTFIFESVHIYDNIVTSHTFSLDATDFYLPPVDPTDLTVQSVQEGIELSWTDLSNTESSFIVYRGILNDFSSSVPIATLDAETETYLDTSVTEGSTYYYYVTANNANGTSQETSSNAVTYIIDHQIGLEITVIEPDEVTITLSELDDFVVTRADSLSISVMNEIFSSYEWYLDGSIIPSQTSSVLSYDCSIISLGGHFLTIMATLNGSLYSESICFSIIE